MDRPRFEFGGITSYLQDSSAGDWSRFQRQLFASATVDPEMAPIEHIVQQLQQRYTVDRDRIFTTGVGLG